MVGLGKIFGRSVKNFGRPGQFLKIWKKIRNVREKISGKMYGKKSRRSKILATRGRGDFVKFYLAPQNACCPSNAPPNSETCRRHWKFPSIAKVLKYTSSSVHRAVARTLIGGCLFIYSCSARLVSFEINFKFINLKRN